MAADDLAPCVARSSAAMVLTVYDKESVSSLNKDFNHFHHLSFKEWYKMQTYIWVAWKEFIQPIKGWMAGVADWISGYFPKCNTI